MGTMNLFKDIINSEDNNKNIVNTNLDHFSNKQIFNYEKEYYY